MNCRTIQLQMKLTTQKGGARCASPSCTSHAPRRGCRCAGMGGRGNTRGATFRKLMWWVRFTEAAWTRYQAGESTHRVETFSGLISAVCLCVLGPRVPGPETCGPGSSPDPGALDPGAQGLVSRSSLPVHDSSPPAPWQLAVGSAVDEDCGAVPPWYRSGASLGGRHRPLEQAS